MVWNISFSGVVALAAAVFELSCGTTDQQKDRKASLKTTVYVANNAACIVAWFVIIEIRCMCSIVFYVLYFYA